MRSQLLTWLQLVFLSIRIVVLLQSKQYAISISMAVPRFIFGSIFRVWSMLDLGNQICDYFMVNESFLIDLFRVSFPPNYSLFFREN